MKEFIEKLIGRLGEQQAEAENEMHRLRSGDYTLPCSYDITDIKEIASESFKESIEIVKQLAEEYGDEELRKSQKIYSFIKREINPYGKPFEGTVYEFGLKVMKYINNIHTDKLAEEYKGAEEQGELVLYPTNAYFIMNHKVYKGWVQEAVYSICRKPLFDIRYDDNSLNSYSGYLGNTVFLDRAEAEAKLKELESESE